MNDLFAASAAALWLGILTAISPCPLATNLAAVGFLGRRFDSIAKVFLAGSLYLLGRTAGYVLIAAVLAKGILSAAETSHALQKNMNLLIGPFLVLVSAFLLDLLSLPMPRSPRLLERLKPHLERMGLFAPFALGFAFAPSFCPSSAVLFFGSLLPLSVRSESGILIPSIYGIATGLPVLAFAVLFAMGLSGANRICAGSFGFEELARRVTGIAILGIGLFLTLSTTLGVLK